jgi:energy-coupling factor transporter ATP-binding protein EcfA2
MPLMYLFGPDGSGKTTLAKALARELEGRNFNVRISWMRGTHTLASMLARFLSKFATFRGSDNPYYGMSIPSCMRRLWQLLEFISVLPVLLFRFMLPSFLGYTVVAERYVPDFIVWVSVTTRDEDYLERFEVRFMLALSVRADVRVYVTASEAELVKRRGGEVDLKFLAEQIKLYNALARLVGSYRVDTTGRDVDSSLREVLGFLGFR